MHPFGERIEKSFPKWYTDSQRFEEGRECVMALERLDKLLAAQGMESRREVKEKIRRGLVLVNGAAARSPDLKIDPDRDQVTVEGVPIF